MCTRFQCIFFFVVVFLFRYFFLFFFSVAFTSIVMLAEKVYKFFFFVFFFFHFWVICLQQIVFWIQVNCVNYIQTPLIHNGTSYIYIQFMRIYICTHALCTDSIIEWSDSIEMRIPFFITFSIRQTWYKI